jgi:hypothetical protein
VRTHLLPALSILVYVDDFIGSVGVLLPLYYAFMRRQLPLVAGIRLLSGPFEALGMDAMIVASLMFVVASSAKVLAAFWLGQGRLDGAVLEIILLGLSTIFWYGFMVPFGPVLGLPQIVLLAVAWGSLR